jgi:hypothetical protein
LKRTTLTVAIALGILPLANTRIPAQVLTQQEVQTFDWSGPITMNLKMATDGVFDEGPAYCYADPDPWFNESDVVADLRNFTVSIYNNAHAPVDDVIFLMAYKEGSFSSVTVGEQRANMADFYASGDIPFGPGGNRPGNGESALYNSAEGVVFMRVRMGVAARDTVNVPIQILPRRGPIVVHLDVYGIRESQVVSSCAASHDVTWNSVCFPSRAVSETWSRLKALFGF